MSSGWNRVQQAAHRSSVQDNRERTGLVTLQDAALALVNEGEAAMFVHVSMDAWARAIGNDHQQLVVAVLTVGQGVAACDKVVDVSAGHQRMRQCLELYCGVARMLLVRHVFREVEVNRCDQVELLVGGKAIEGFELRDWPFSGNGELGETGEFGHRGSS